MNYPEQANEKTGSILPDELFIVAAFNAIAHLKWEVAHLTKQGIVATVIQGQDIRIMQGEAGIDITTKGGDEVANQNNVEILRDTFKDVIANLDPGIIGEQYNLLVPSFEDDAVLFTTQEPRKQNFLELFIPKKHFFITPIIVNINILIFITMVIMGIDFFSPDGSSVIEWGGNFKPVTLNGQPWRMLTACFLHFGILHLVFNMYALLYIGVLLEPLIGKSRYLAAYLLTGIASSAASLYFNQAVVSAGASGAIFGMYGVFLAMLAGGVVHKSAQKELLTSIGIFVVFNLSFGFAQSGIDNAGHVGGLVSGFIIGFIMIPGIKHVKRPGLNLAGLLASIVIGLGSGWFAYNYSSDVINQYQTLIEKFSANEHAAVNSLQGIETKDDATAIKVIKEQVLPYWDKNVKINKEISTLNLPEALKKHAALIENYTNLRIKNFNLLIKKANEPTTKAYDYAIEKSNTEIQSILNELSERAK